MIQIRNVPDALHRKKGEVVAARAEEAIDDLGLRIVRHGHLDLATRAWQLRGNVTAYDAVYVALAESLEATVVTCDRPFGATRGLLARIEVIRP
jgi:predicted nucleic acid-binding protein